MTKKKIKKWLLRHCVNKNGILDLSGLDFSDFDGEVNISCMKVKKVLVQSYQEVGGDLYQDHQEVEGSVYQGSQRFGNNIHQRDQRVKRYIYKDWKEEE